jgi:hypothetical protein
LFDLISLVETGSSKPEKISSDIIKKRKSFLETKTKLSAVTEQDVIAVILFDTVFITAFFDDMSIRSELEAYCGNILEALFLGTRFPKTGSHDNYDLRTYYLNQAKSFYANTAYIALGC